MRSRDFLTSFGLRLHGGLHALAASCMQSSQCFASTLQKQLFYLKNEDAIKKTENLRDICP